jgi:hypothetical protein
VTDSLIRWQQFEKLAFEIRQCGHQRGDGAARCPMTSSIHAFRAII